MAVAQESLCSDLRPGEPSDQGTYMEGRSPAVLWRELQKGAALAGAPRRLAAEGRRRGAGQGARAGGEAGCGATRDMAGPGR